jgi:uncharacterized RDD family membrane protein YckC
MSAGYAMNVARSEDEGAMAGLAAGRWLRFAAAPAFAIMALLTVVLDSGVPNVLCSAAGRFGLSGMAPMYLLMAVFHSAPWLNLISRRRNVVHY